MVDIVIEVRNLVRIYRLGHVELRAFDAVLCGVRPHTPVRRILAPTDLTVRSRNVVNYDARFAAECAAHLTVLHVYREPYNVAFLRGSPAYASIERHLNDTKNALESFGKYGDCRTQFRIEIPCEEIIEATKDLQIDMLVISTHPHQ